MGGILWWRKVSSNLVFTLKYRVFKIPDSGAKNPESGPEHNSGKILRNPEFPKPEFRTSLVPKHIPKNINNSVQATNTLHQLPIDLIPIFLFYYPENNIKNYYLIVSPTDQPTTDGYFCFYATKISVKIAWKRFNKILLRKNVNFQMPKIKFKYYFLTVFGALILINL